MVDLLIFCTPFALIHSVGGIGAMVGTGLVTLFHSSILNLAKMFLDPFNNDDYGNDAGISVNVGTLLQETNVGSERWRKSAAWVPEATRPRLDRMNLLLAPDALPLAECEILVEAGMSDAELEEAGCPTPEGDGDGGDGGSQHEAQREAQREAQHEVVAESVEAAVEFVNA